jgi:hypothetical protein
LSIRCSNAKEGAGLPRLVENRDGRGFATTELMMAKKEQGSEDATKEINVPQKYGGPCVEPNSEHPVRGHDCNHFPKFPKSRRENVWARMNLCERQQRKHGRCRGVFQRP